MGRSQAISFLDLPQYIRKRVYPFTELVGKCEFHGLLYEYTKQSPPPNNYFWPAATVETDQDRQAGPCELARAGLSCEHIKRSASLLRVCKQVYTETLAIFYTRNKFSIDLFTHLSVPDNTLSLITRLQIKVTSTSCVTCHRCRDLSPDSSLTVCPLCHKCCERGKGFPLSLQNEVDRRSLSHLQALCNRLGRTCNNKLRLTIICDCADLATAKAVSKILEILPAIKDATVRLGQSPGSEIQLVAEQAVARLTDQRPSQSFPFTRLPIELQKSVLRYAEFVAPDYLSWNEPRITQDNYPSSTGNTLPDMIRLAPYRELWQRCCLKCSDFPELCCCPGRHAASCSQCFCWKSPTTWFLMSKAIRDLTRDIFFSHNKFILWETSLPRIRKHKQTGPDYRYLVSTTKILRGMPSDWAANIRWLRFVFVDFRSSDVLSGSPGYASWQEVTLLIKSRFKVSLLTIELDFAMIDKAIGLSDYVHVPEEAWATYQNVAALFIMDGQANYKDFFVHLAHPNDSWCWDRVRWLRERVLERRVMGEEYDAASRGKYHDDRHFPDETRGPREYFASHGQDTDDLTGDWLARKKAGDIHYAELEQQGLVI